MTDFIPVRRDPAAPRQLSHGDLANIIYRYQGKHIYAHYELLSAIVAADSRSHWSPAPEAAVLAEEIQAMPIRYLIDTNECNVLHLALNVAKKSRSVKFLEALLKTGRRLDMAHWKKNNGDPVEWIERLDLNVLKIANRGVALEYIARFQPYIRSQVAMVLLAHGAKVAPEHFDKWLPDNERELEALIRAGADPALTTWGSTSGGYSVKYNFIPWFYEPGFGLPEIANPRVLHGFLRNGCDASYLKNERCMTCLRQNYESAVIVLAHYVGKEELPPLAFPTYRVFIAAGAMRRHPVISFVATGEPVLDSTEAELAPVRQQLHAERMRHMRYHAARLCFGLQSADLPALVLLAILDSIMPASLLVPMHHKWRLLTFLKHWCQKKDEQRRWSRST